LGARKQKGSHRIAKTDYGHLCLRPVREKNLSFNNNYII